MISRQPVIGSDFEIWTFFHVNFHPTSSVNVNSTTGLSNTRVKIFQLLAPPPLDASTHTNINLFPEPTEEPTSLDSWSVVWYIASFGGLIGFFLIISCSEWCCRKNRSPSSAYPRSSSSPVPSIVAETPPPSYDHFAPPSYDSLSGRTTEKGEFDVYVVPVHALKPIMEGGAEGDTPPSYGTAGRAWREEDWSKRTLVIFVIIIVIIAVVCVRFVFVCVKR